MPAFCLDGATRQWTQEGLAARPWTVRQTPAAGQVTTRSGGLKNGSGREADTKVDWVALGSAAQGCIRHGDGPAGPAWAALGAGHVVEDDARGTDGWLQKPQRD